MTARRPLCAICHLRPRLPGSARCDDCGPGRIAGLTERTLAATEGDTDPTNIARQEN